MYGFTRTEELPHPPEAVFDFVAEQGNLPRWSPEVLRSDVVGGGPVHRGSQLRQTRRMGKRETTSLVEVVVHERPSRHAVRARVMGVEAVFTFRFEPAGAGTRATFECEARGRGLARLWESWMGGMMEKADDRRLVALRVAMSQQTAR